MAVPNGTYYIRNPNKKVLSINDTVSLSGMPKASDLKRRAVMRTTVTHVSGDTYYLMAGNGKPRYLEMKPNLKRPSVNTRKTVVYLYLFPGSRDRWAILSKPLPRWGPLAIVDSNDPKKGAVTHPMTIKSGSKSKYKKEQMMWNFEKATDLKKPKSNKLQFRLSQDSKPPGDDKDDTVAWVTELANQSIEQDDDGRIISTLQQALDIIRMRDLSFGDFWRSIVGLLTSLGIQDIISPGGLTSTGKVALSKQKRIQAGDKNRRERMGLRKPYKN